MDLEEKAEENGKKGKKSCAHQVSG